MDTDVGAGNFGFALDNPKFSDKVLSIEIIPGPVENNTSDMGVRKRKRSKNDDVLWVKTLHINSAILAAKSPFFYKLFSNGMTESERVATLRIQASEEAALMEVLNFVYKNTLSPATPTCFLDILMSAHKFEVASCIQYCSQQLSKRLSELPMTLDFALRYLDLPSSVLHADALVQLTESAKSIVAFQFRDINKFKNQVLNLSLVGIEAILSSDDIQVPSEDVLYDLALKWSELHYPQLEERREVLETHLRHLIRFPYMTSLKLKEIATGTNFSPEVASEIVLEALFFQTGTQYKQRQLASVRQVADDTTVNTCRCFVERAYTLRPVKSITLELPRHCVAYMDLKREECLHLFPSGNIRSQTFQLDERRLYLSAYCHMDLQNDSQCFGLYLAMQRNGSASLTVNYELAAWSKETKEYKTAYSKRQRLLAGGRSIGPRNLFNTTWSSFIAVDNPCFIDGKLLLRAVVTI